METVIVAAAAAGAIGLVHDSHNVWCLRLLLGGVLATPLALAAHRLGRLGSRLPVIAGSIAAAGVLAAVTAGLPTVDALRDPAFSWPYRLTLLAAMLVPFVVPGAPFAQFVRRFFEQTTTWSVLCVCALAALGVVTLALQELFDIRIEKLAFDAAIIAGCGFVLVYLHRLLDDRESRGRMPELWRRLATMIGAPFVAVMLVILGVYEVVARTRGELPRNVLSPLIMAAGLVGFLSTLIISSVLDESRGTSVLTPADPHRWARRWSVRLTRAFPVVLLALLPMAGWALWLRVDQHGLTPFRVVRGMGLLCLTGLGALGTLRWARGRAALSWEVPAAIIAFALVAAFGPLSAVQLSIRSQSARVAHLLDEAGAGRVVSKTPAMPPIELAPEHYNELEDALRSLAEVGGRPAIQRLLTGELDDCVVPMTWTARHCLEQLGIHERGTPPPSPAITGRQTSLQAHGRVATAVGEVEMIRLSRERDEPDRLDSAAAPGFRLTADRVVLLSAGAPAAQATLDGVLPQAQNTVGPPVWTRPLIRSDGTIAGELVVEQLEVWQPDGHAAQAIGLTGMVIWRR